MRCPGARLGFHRRDIWHQPTFRATVSAQFQLSQPANSQVVAPHHRLRPNLVLSQVVLPGPRIPAVATNTVTYVDGDPKTLEDQGAVESVGFSA